MDSQVDEVFKPNPLGEERQPKEIPPVILATFGVCVFWGIVFIVYSIFLCLAPKPRSKRQSEKAYNAVVTNSNDPQTRQLPSWFDRWRAIRMIAKTEGKAHVDYPDGQIDQGEILFSVVVPAYNEANRIRFMLDDAVTYIREHYDELRSMVLDIDNKTTSSNLRHGWEIVVVSDGSTDKTAEVALDFAKQASLFDDREPSATASNTGTLRVMTLGRNGGKGGAVRHGLKFVRGQYILFADADGASPFYNFKDLLEGSLLQAQKDAQGRALAIGSRAHLVRTDSVTQRSFLRNFLMRTFHTILKTLTPPETANIQDTQCGFKLLTRPALPFIVPYLHFEGWIFDVEMLMLAERAGIPMGEYAVKGWKEIQGSKLNVLFDSIEMAWNLIVLRGAWMLGVYQIR